MELPFGPSWRGIMPTLMNGLIITAFAVLGITASKFILNKWPVPGATKLINGV